MKRYSILFEEVKVSELNGNVQDFYNGVAVGVSIAGGIAAAFLLT
ncbi:hypothetical protein [Ligilactobacillus agilis]|nr:hypothetical protein [Ligilactobacillus agilis]